MKSLCIAVPKKKGEDVRKVLLDNGLLNRELAIERDDEVLYFPIIGNENKKEVLGYEVCENEFQVLERETKSYKELLDIPDELKSKLPTSFDIIGKGGIFGEERIRDLVIVVGKKSTETIHKEYGIELETDPSKVYFSPRLATEHWRVAESVEDGEVVIDMFCGIGPFSILIAKHWNPKKIYAIDINKEAIGYLKRNIKKNKVSNIEPYMGDSKVIIPTLPPYDRIIMNLPHSAFDFLSSAFSNIKDNGTIHYYEILDHDKKDKRWKEIEKMSSEQGIKIDKLGEREVHTYSPESSLYCFDLKVISGKDDV
jgi:tRNA (guanine37-N1)-methyltransferase